MKILSIFLIMFFVCLTICEAGQKKKGSTKKDKSSSSQNPSDVKDGMPKDPIVYNILTRKMDTLNTWTGFTSLQHYVEAPKETKDYDNMVNEAKDKLASDIGNTMSVFFERVEIALQGRKLRYVRLIGPGSMHAHSNHDLYEEDKIGKKSREAFLYFPEVYKKKFIKGSQIRAVYQFAVQLLTIEHFDKIQNPKKKEEIDLKNKGKAIASSSETNDKHSIIGTFEDLYVHKSEKEYIEGKYKINVINPLTKKNKNSNNNLYKIPKIVEKMEEDEATLIIMLECSLDMATEIINSYKKDNKLKNLILVESAIQHEYERNEDGRGYLLNFMKTNKLEQLKAFPDSILAYNNFLSVVTYIYFNKLGVEEMNKLLASPKEEQEEEVKQEKEEKVKDEMKKGKKEDVKEKGKEKVEDEKKGMDNNEENKEGVKDVKKEDVKLKGKEEAKEEMGMDVKKDDKEKTKKEDVKKEDVKKDDVKVDDKEEVKEEVKDETEEEKKDVGKDEEKKEGNE